MLERLRAQRTAKRGRLDALFAITDRDPSADEVREAETLSTEVADLDRQIGVFEARSATDTAATEAAERAQAERDAEAARTRDDLAAQTRTEHGQTGTRGVGGGVVVREERTYSREKSARGEASFFSDSYRFQKGDTAARARLERHGVELTREGEGTERAVSSAGFAGLVVPQYLVDMAAPILRSGRPVANMIQGLPLPAQGMSLDVPRGTTGAAAASQATENSALQNTDEVWADLVVPVRTIGGQQDVSRQSLERGTPGTDEMVYMDLAGAYFAQLDGQVINGSGSSGQHLGMVNTSGKSQATAFGAALTPANFQLKVAGQIAAVSNGGSTIVPRFEIMNPRRWGWMTGLVDSANRPLVGAAAQGVMNGMAVNVNPGAYGGDGDPNDTAGYTVVGVGPGGLPVVTDSNVPTTVGTNSEDLVLVIDPTKLYLWEDGDGLPRKLDFEQTAGGNLTVKLVVYGYSAFTAARYPQAVGVVGGLDTVGGNGLIAPTF